MYWLFMYASKYIFSQTTAVKPSQNFLISLKKTEFTDLSAGWNSSGGSRISQRGTPTPGGAPTYYFANFFAKNCMKMKGFGLGRGWASLGLVWIHHWIVIKKLFNIYKKKSSLTNHVVNFIGILKIHTEIPLKVQDVSCADSSRESNWLASSKVM